MTPDEKRKARYARYNASAKGKARNQRYEEKHKRGFRLGKVSGYKAKRYE